MRHRLLLIAGLLLPACTIHPKPEPPKPVCADKHPICSATVTDGCWKDEGTVCTWVPPVVNPETQRPAQAIGNVVQRQTAGRFEVPVVGVIPVWPPDDANGIAPASFTLEGVQIPYMWSLFSPEWADAVKAKGGNTLLVRIGPEPASDSCCGLEAIGGPYLEDGKTLNPAYWSYAHKALHRATANDQMVLFSVLDGWRIKHTIWDRQQRAWCESLKMLTCPKKERAESILEHRKTQQYLKGVGVHLPWSAFAVDHLMDVPLTQTVKDHVNQMVYETCNYRNLYYEISNESDLTPGWSPEWERAMLDQIRIAQGQEGCNQVGHPVGSNSRDEEGYYDFMISHSPGDKPYSPVRPLVINEYNPAIPAATFHAQLCDFQQKGSAFWLWRSDASDELFAQQMNSLRCDVAPEFPLPSDGVQPPISALGFRFTVEVTIDTTPVIWDHAYCDSIGMGWMADGTYRSWCPVRNECGPTGMPVPGDPQSYECNLRLPWEQWAMKRWAPKFFSDGNVTLVDENGFRVRVEGGTFLLACDESAEHCTRLDL